MASPLGDEVEVHRVVTKNGSDIFNPPALAATERQDGAVWDHDGHTYVPRGTWSAILYISCLRLLLRYLESLLKTSTSYLSGFWMRVTRTVIHVSEILV